MPIFKPQFDLQDESCKIESVIAKLGLPNQLAMSYKRSFGIHYLFQWQVDCLAKFRQDRNFIYSAPTSGGKTIVAELLLLQRVWLSHRAVADGENEDFVMFILPFVSLISEKERRLNVLLQAFPPMGPAQRRPRLQTIYSHKRALLKEGVNMVICTIDKAN